jgi:hypothetical protein
VKHLKCKWESEYGLEYDEKGHYVGHKPADDRYSILGLTYNPNPKDKWSHPYSYDPFIVWYGNARKGDSVVYSDRLVQWDYDKYMECAKTVRTKYNTNSFDINNPVQVKEFLSLYYDKQVVLTAIVEGCNVSNGYPYWILYFRDK